MSAIAHERGLPFGTYEKGFIHDGIVMTPEAAASQLKMPAGVWEIARETPLTDDEFDAIDTYLETRVAAGAGRSTTSGGSASRTPLESAASFVSTPLVHSSSCSATSSGTARCSSGTSPFRRWERGCSTASAGHDRIRRSTSSSASILPRSGCAITRHASGWPSTSQPMRRCCRRTYELSRPRIPPARTCSWMRRSSGSSTRRRWGSSLPHAGYPVVVAADTHYRGRGFTSDPDTAAEYWEAADRVLSSPPDDAERQRIRELARRYAVLFFFRFHQVLAAVTEDGRSRPRIRVDSAPDLDKGWDPPMDRVVTGILEGIAPIAPPGAALQRHGFRLGESAILRG